MKEQDVIAAGFLIDTKDSVKSTLRDLRSEETRKYSLHFMKSEPQNYGTTIEFIIKDKKILELVLLTIIGEVSYRLKQLGVEE
jgi:hypothetical protein